MADLSTQPAEIAFTVTVKRKDTGIEETYPMVGYVNLPEPDPENEEQ